MAQSNKWDAHYKTVDSFINRGLPESANDYFNKHIRGKINESQDEEFMKMSFYEIYLTYSHAEDDTTIMYSVLNKMNSLKKPVHKAMWQSIAANLLSQYFNAYRYKIINRTSQNQLPEDFQEWSADQFYEQIVALYWASLQPAKELQGIKISKYGKVLTKSTNTELVRPTLYDLMAQRALSFFKYAESSGLKPLAPESPDNPRLLSPFNEFVGIDLKEGLNHPNSADYYSFVIYQNLIDFHSKNKHREALVEIDMDRLAFALSKSTEPNKKELYYESLKHLYLQNKDNQPGQIVYVKMLSFLSQEPIDENGEVGLAEDVYTLKGIVVNLEYIIQNYANTEASANAIGTVNSLYRERISIKLEEEVLPGQNTKILVDYKNIEKVYFTLFQLSREDFASSKKSTRDNLKQLLLSSKKIKSWSVALPKGNDFRDHTTEVLMEALPLGNYVLVADVFDRDTLDKIPSVASFQISELCLVHAENYDKNHEMFVLNRKTGQSIRGAKVDIFKEEYDRKKGSYYLKLLNSYNTNEEGLVSIKKKNLYSIYYRISKDADTLMGSLYISNPYSSSPSKDIQSLIFTDRKIYRPGQEILLKGIVFQPTAENEFKAVKNKKTKVRLYDANNQEVGVQDVLTNEYGSYQTSFEIPEGLLNGTFRITDSYGSQSVSVEEYKRPKFYLEFDKVETTYQLNESIKVPGKAMAYSGIGLSGATVKYKVTRQDYSPYRWRYYWSSWSSSETDIAHGTIETDEQGHFEIPFDLLPDKKHRNNKNIFYHYKIKVDVTDINGETHTANTSIGAGSLPYIVQLTVDGQPNLNKLEEAKASIQNLNGVDMDVPVSIYIYRLENPGFFRDRMWPKPEIQQFTKAEFQSLFPYDEYEYEFNPMSWEKGKLIQSMEQVKVNKNKLNIDAKQFKENGYYLIEAIALTASGDTIMDKAVFHLFDPAIGEQSEKPLQITTNTNYVEPGTNINYYISSVFGKQQNILMQHGSHKEEYKSLLQPGIYNHKILEEERGGIKKAGALVYNNRFYAAETYTVVPFTNKQLNIEWATHRDKLEPGAEEEWTMTITGSDKEKVSAEMVSVLYDASLDDIKQHYWPGISGMYSSFYNYSNWSSSNFSSKSISVNTHSSGKYLTEYFSKTYPDLILFKDIFYSRYNSYRYSEPTMSAAPNMKSAPRTSGDAAGSIQMDYSSSESEELDLETGFEKADAPMELKEEGVAEADNFEIRSNFNETAFFYPHLYTNKDGNVSFKFKLPESLTTWKMMSFAHTQDMRMGYTSGKVIGQKDLMLQPNVPRFFRQNDEVVLSAKISNLTENAMEGTAYIEIVDELTEVDLNGTFGVQNNQLAFNIKAEGSTEVSWKVNIPRDRFDAVKVRVKAKAGNFTDGEEHLIPVLTNRVFVTESMPLPVKGSKTTQFSLSKMSNNASSSLTTYAYTFEYTANPAWYAVQALPYLMEYPYDCTEQMFSKVYANALAKKIVENNPAIKTTFKKWQEKDTAALLSNLEKNQELKSALLEETPWLRDAKDETQRKKNIARLFDDQLVNKQINSWLNKIKKNQNSDGGWPWFIGMQSSEYITQHILTGFGKLRKMEALDFKDYKMENEVNYAMGFVDRAFLEHFEKLKENNPNWKNINYAGHYAINYMYLRTFYPEKVMPKKVQEAFDFYYSVAKKHPADLPLLQKAQMAIIAHKNKDPQTAEYIIQSLQETAYKNEELGMYWKGSNSPYYWYEAPISTQATIIEAFVEVGGRDLSVDEMKTWLLKQKQTQNWNSTISTADACYALLSQGSNWLSEMPEVNVQLGSNHLKLTQENTEAGTGYFKKRYEAEEVRPEMANITIQVNQPAEAANRPSWGAVYWQYFEDMDKVTAHSSPLNVSKKLFVRKQTDKGEQLIEVNENDQLQLGDRLTVRVVIQVDRTMEYIHLKDMRAGAFEPIEALSGYRYQNGLGYYQSVGDLAMNFFFDRINKGTYVLEYDMFVNARGTYSNGISTIQCMYAPEFGAHTEGLRVEIK